MKVATWIKRMAGFSGGLGVATSIRMAIWLWDERYSDSLYREMSFIVPFVGILVSIIVALLVYGYGQLIEDMRKQRENSDRLLSLLSKNTVAIRGEQNSGESQENESSTTETWICKSCGERNKRVYPYCMKCGKY